MSPLHMPRLHGDHSITSKGVNTMSDNLDRLAASWSKAVDRECDARKYGTTNPVLIEARIAHDPSDEFAWVQGWRFVIAQFLADAGGYVPDFRGSDDIREDFEYEQLEMLYPAYVDGVSNQDVRELTYALKILDRYREWLRVAGGR